MSIIPCEQLVTRAEFEELIEKINQLLGKTEDGTVVNVLATGELTSATALGGAVLLAQTAIQDVKLDGSVGESIGRAIAKGEAQWVKIKGNGGRTPLPDLTKITKTHAKGIAKNAIVSTKVAKVGSQVLRGVANVAGTAVSLGVSIANTKILGDRIDRVENTQLKAQQDYADSVIKVFNKHQDNFDEMEAEMTEAITIIEGQQEQINLNNQDIEKNREDINKLEDSNYELEKNLKKANREVTKANTAIEELATQYEVDMSDVGDVIEELKTTLAEATEQIEVLEFAILQSRVDIANLKLQVEDQEERITFLSATISLNRAEIINLKSDIELNTAIDESSTRRLESKIKLLENQSTSGGGVPSGVQNSIAQQQTSTIQLLDKLTGNNSEFSTDYFDIVNSESSFETTFNDLLGNVPNINDLETERMTPEQLEEFSTNLREGLTGDFNAQLLAVIAASITPQLLDIKNQTSPSAIGTTVSDTVCDLTNSPTGCLRTGLRDPIMNNLNTVGELADTGLGALNTLLTGRVLTAIGDTQAFLNRAWGSTTIQKTLTTANTILAFHNATMLSRDLGGSINDVTNLVLNELPIPGFDDTEINVGAWISNKLTQFTTGIIGEEAYTTIGNALNSANRILVAGQGVISATQGMKNAIQEGQEVIANRVGTLGNTMLEQGLFEDGSFEFMNDNVAFKGVFNKFTNYVEGLEDVVSEINQLVQSGLEVQKNYNEIVEGVSEITTARDELEQIATEYHDAKVLEEAEAETESASPIITNTDLVRKEGEE